jgi:hypothetical protein
MAQAAMQTTTQTAAPAGGLDPIDEFIALPRDQQMATLQKLSPDKQDKLLGLVKTRKGKQDFSAPADNIEGLYQMRDRNGKVTQVPYSKVRAASQAGLQMFAPADIRKYVADAKADPNLQSMGGNGVTVTGLNSAGQPIVAPQDPNAQEGNAFERFATAGGEVVGGALSGLYHAAVDRPRDASEEAVEDVVGASDPVGVRAALIGKRMLVDPALQQVRAAANELQQANAISPASSFSPKPEAAAHREMALGHILAAALPGVGPWAAQTGEELGQQIGTGNYAGALGTAAGTAALYEAPEALKTAAKRVPRTARSTMEALTNTGPRELKEMAQETVKANTVAAEEAARENQANTEKYQQDKTEAEQQTREREDLRAARVRKADAEAADAHAKKLAEVAEHNRLVADTHAHDTQTIQAENDAKKAQYEAQKAKAEQIQQEAAQTETSRGQLARQVQELSTRLVDRIKRVQAEWKDNAAYRRGEEARVAQAQAAGDTTAEYQPRGKLDRAYDEIRKATANETVPAESLTDAVQTAEKKIKGSAENIKIFKDILSKAPEAEPEELPFTTSTGGTTMIPKGHNLYAVLAQQLTEPGKPLKFGDLQGYYSELGDKLAGGDLPDDVYHALRSLQSDIGEMMQDMANDSGVGSKLRQTQKLYRQYMETFKESAGPNHSGSPIAKALQAADPAYAIEPLLEEKTAQRVRNMLTKFDPPDAGVGGAGKLYDNFWDANRKLDALGKPVDVPEAPVEPSYRQPPTAPSPDHPIPKYRTRKAPEPPRPAAERVPEPPRAKHPEEPEEVIPERKTIGPEDYRARQAENTEAAAKGLRSLGVRRALNSLFYTTPTAVFSVLLGHPGYSIAELAMTPTILAGSHMLADALEKPEVVNWISQVTPQVADAYDKLPPEEKAVFTQNLRQMVELAQKKGMAVSPVLKAMALGTAASQNQTGGKTVKELRDEAEKRKPAPGPQSSAQPSGRPYTHVFDEERGAIVPA